MLPYKGIIPTKRRLSNEEFEGEFTQFVNFDDVKEDARKEDKFEVPFRILEKWIIDNLFGVWYDKYIDKYGNYSDNLLRRHEYGFWFEKEEDAVAFKIRWSG